MTALRWNRTLLIPTVAGGARPCAWIGSLFEEGLKYAEDRTVKRRFVVRSPILRWFPVQNHEFCSAAQRLPGVAERLGTYVPDRKVYFGLSQTPGVLRSLDEWLRHRLRALQLKYRRRGTTVFRELRALGASQD